MVQGVREWFEGEGVGGSFERVKVISKLWSGVLPVGTTREGDASHV